MARRSSSSLILVLALACSSEKLEHPSGSAGDGPGGAGAGGEAAAGRGGESGASEGTDAGSAGESMGGQAGSAAGPTGAGEGGAPPGPVIGYRLAGIAYGTFESGEGGASGASGGAGGEVAEAGEGGAGSAALPHIDRAECNFYLDFVDVVEDQNGSFEAFAVGEVFRNVYSGDRRWEFSAFIGGPATFDVAEDGSTELRAFGDQTGSKPFWTELEVLSGVRNGNGTSGGAWSCASLELFEPGFPDTEGVATGTWLLVPVN